MDKRQEHRGGSRNKDGNAGDDSLESSHVNEELGIKNDEEVNSERVDLGRVPRSVNQAEYVDAVEFGRLLKKDRPQTANRAENIANTGLIGSSSRGTMSNQRNVLAEGTDETPPPLYSTSTRPVLHSANTRPSRPVLHSANTRPSLPVLDSVGSRPVLYSASSGPIVYPTSSQPGVYSSSFQPIVRSVSTRPIPYSASSRPGVPAAFSRQPVMYSAMSQPVVHSVSSTLGTQAAWPPAAFEFVRGSLPNVGQLFSNISNPHYAVYQHYMRTWYRSMLFGGYAFRNSPPVFEIAPPRVEMPPPMVQVVPPMVGLRPPMVQMDSLRGFVHDPMRPTGNTGIEVQSAGEHSGEATSRDRSRHNDEQESASRDAKRPRRGN